MVEYLTSGRGEMAYAPGLGPDEATHAGSTPAVRTDSIPVSLLLFYIYRASRSWNKKIRC